MIQLGFGFASLEYEKNPKLQALIRSYAASNIIPERFEADGKKLRGFNIAKKAAGIINSTWKQNVAQPVLQEGFYTIQLNIPDSFLQKLQTIDFLAQERSSIDDIKPEYANSFEEDAINYYEKLGGSAVNQFVQAKANGFLEQVLSTLKAAFPTINYNVISDQEAREITKNARNPYVGQGPSFFYNGQVYIVEGNVNPVTLIHEFLHPLVKAIEVENNVLFNNLYREAVQVDQAYSLGTTENLAEEKNTLSENEYKREFITRVLQNVAINRLAENREEGILFNFINKLFYAIKTLFRKVFGSKVNVSKLSPYTSLTELADMLKSSEFDLKAEVVSVNDFVEYLTDISKQFENFASALTPENYKNAAGVNPNNVQLGFSSLDDYIKRLSSVVESNKSFIEESGKVNDEIRTLLLESTTGNFNKILRDLRGITNIPTIEKLNEEFSIEVNKEIEDTKKAKLLASSMLQINSLLSQLISSNYINKVKDSTSTEDVASNISQIQYLKRLFQSYQTFANSLSETVNTINAKTPINIRENVIIDSIKNINTNAAIGINEMDNLLFNNIQKLITEAGTLINDSIDSLYDPAIQKIEEALKENPGNTRLLKQKEYYEKTKKELRLTDDKIKSLLKGESYDSSFIEGWVLSAMQSSDPIIGTLASIVKTAYNNANINTSEIYSEIAPVLDDLQKKAGINKSNYAQMYKMLVREGSRSITTVGENGEPEIKEEKDIYVWLHPTKVDAFRLEVEKFDNEINKLRNSGELVKAIEKEKELEEFLSNYSYRPYSEEVYASRKKLLADERGRRIYAKLYYINIDIQQLETEIDLLKTIGDPKSIVQELFQKEKDLESLLLRRSEITSILNLDGSSKTGQNLEDVKFYLETKKNDNEIYEENEEETNDNFQKAYNLHKEMFLAEEEKNGPLTKERIRKAMSKLQDWFKKNTRIYKTPEFYAKVKEIFDQIENENKSITDPNLKKLYDKKTEIHKELNLIKSLYTNTVTGDLQYNSMDPKALARVKELEEELYKTEVSIDIQKGLPSSISDKDIVFLHKVSKLYRGDYRRKTEEELTIGNLVAPDILEISHSFIYNKYKEIYDELGTFRKTQNQGNIDRNVKKLWDQYFTIQGKDRSEQYKTIRDEIIESNKHLIPADKQKEAENVKFIDKDETFLALLENSESFRNFIEQYHTKVEVKHEGQQAFSYVPHSFFYETVVHEKFLKHITINGESISRYPIKKYQSIKIKDKYKTERIVGKTVDVYGNWLPIPMDDASGKKPLDNTFIDDDYYELKKNNKPLWDLLEKLKEISFQKQMEAPKSGRLNFQIPTYVASNLELVRKTLKDKNESPFSQFINSIRKKYFGVTGDEFEEGFSNVTTAESAAEKKQKITLVSLDFFGDEIKKVPVSGKYPVELENVSMDLPLSMFRYFFSLSELKEKTKILPIAKGIQDVISNESNSLKNMQALNRGAFLSSGISVFQNKKGLYVRKLMVDDFIKRIFEGEQVKGFLSEETALLKIFQNLSTFTSTVFLSSPESAIKNRVQMEFQNMINLAAKDEIDWESYKKGKLWATRYMNNLIKNVYAADTYTLEEMLVDYFDPIQGRTKKIIGERFNRSAIMDAMEPRSIILGPRKWLETQGAIEVFAQMMYFTKVKQYINGVEIEIPYLEAFHLVDGKLELKPGIDSKYDKGGAFFNLTMNKIQQKLTLLNGDTTALGKSYGDKFVLWNWVLSMQRFFFMMFMNRFGAKFKKVDEDAKWYQYEALPRMNYTTGEAQMGFYISSLGPNGTIWRLLRSALKDWHYFTPMEKKNTIKLISELIISLIMFIIVRMLFDYDSDDEDRYKKLRARSAPLPFLGTADEGNFDFGGFALNKALQMMLLIQNEHNTFIPFPGLGLKTYIDLTKIKAVTLNPTVESIYKVVDYLWKHVTLDDRAYYDKRVGPYDWQQKDSAKIINVVLKYFGLTGSTIDPVTSTQNIESFRAR